MNFKTSNIFIIFLLYILSGCNNNASTWNKKAKYVVETQCGIFTKVRVYTNHYTEEEMQMLLYALKNKHPDYSKFSNKDYETMNCCAKKIFDTYTLNEFMAKKSAKVELQNALNQCR